MSFTKKTTSLLCAAMLACLTLAGCGGQEKASGLKNIGLVQYMEHDALNAAKQGFIDGLKERGFEEGKNLTIDRQDAQANQATLQAITQRFTSARFDLICAIATPAAQSLANATSTTPIVGTAITDYEKAGLVKSNQAPGRNVTGTSDMNPIKEQIELLQKLCPEARHIGCIYSAGEVNSELQARQMKEHAESKGFTVTLVPIAHVADLPEAARRLAGSADVLYEPTDNLIVSHLPTLLEITDQARLPVICGEPNQVRAGCLATYGIDYYQLGLQTGRMAGDILEGKKKPEEMPIETARNLKIYLNARNAEQLGITIPEELKRDAIVLEKENR